MKALGVTAAGFTFTDLNSCAQTVETLAENVNVGNNRAFVWQCLYAGTVVTGIAAYWYFGRRKHTPNRRRR